MEENTMKKSIIFGVCITIFVLILTPSISAQQYSIIEESVRSEINDTIEQYDSIIQTRDNKKSTNEGNEAHSEPTIFKFIISTIVSVFFAIIGTIFGMIFGPLLTLLIRVVTAPAILLTKIIAFVINLIF
jgi:hypothetical protein